MSKKSRRIAKEAARAGTRTVGGAISLVLKIAGTVVLIGITTMLVFACIFSMYCKANYSTGLDV